MEWPRKCVYTHKTERFSGHWHWHTTVCYALNVRAFKREGKRWTATALLRRCWWWEWLLLLDFFAIRLKCVLGSFLYIYLLWLLFPLILSLKQKKERKTNNTNINLFNRKSFSLLSFKYHTKWRAFQRVYITLKSLLLVLISFRLHFCFTCVLFIHT